MFRYDGKIGAGGGLNYSGCCRSGEKGLVFGCVLMILLLIGFVYGVDVGVRRKDLLTMILSFWFECWEK